MEITLSLRILEIFFYLPKLNDWVITERNIFWLKTSLIKLRSAVPLINLSTIFSENQWALSAFLYLISVVKGPCQLWSVPTVHYYFYFYYKQMLYLNNTTDTSNISISVCINITFTLLFLRKIDVFIIHIYHVDFFVFSSQEYHMSLNVITQFLKPEIQSHYPFYITEA